MRLDTPGRLNRLGKKVTPLLSRLAAHPRLTNLIELTAAYLNLVIGKGAGTGWDRGEEFAASRLIARQDPVILDLGANRGAWTLELRRLVGTGGRWVLVEPAAECCKLLCELDDVELIEAAVSDHSGMTVLYTPGGGSGLASLHRREDSVVDSKSFEERQVPVKTIDEILEERGIEQVELLKMDLEGHELFALKGASAALRARRIRALTFEFGAANINSRTFFKDFWDLLTCDGYEIARIYPGGRTVPITEYYEDLEYFRGATNYVATVGPDVP